MLLYFSNIVLYLNRKHVEDLGAHWPEILLELETTLECMSRGEYEQPVKPYISLPGGPNRIIAMPAFIGGPSPIAGLKWIASVPANVKDGKPRAHAITVLNDVHTGEPICIVNSTLLSARRTAGISGIIMQRFLERCPLRRIKIGIIGFGEVGRQHLDMMKGLLADRIEAIGVYDTDRTKVLALEGSGLSPGCIPFASPESLIRWANIIVTATTSTCGYIEEAPLAGSLILNVSLRDFKPEFRQFVDYMIVDSWDEVCRKGTDIEHMYSRGLLAKADAYPLVSIECQKVLQDRAPDSTVMFNPMGLAAFDVSIIALYYRKAVRSHSGLKLT